MQPIAGRQLNFRDSVYRNNDAKLSKVFENNPNKMCVRISFSDKTPNTSRLSFLQVEDPIFISVLHFMGCLILLK